MLVLSRKPEESVHFSGGIVVTVLSIEGNRVKLGISSPGSCKIFRSEVFAQLSPEGREALAAPVRNIPVEAV